MVNASQTLPYHSEPPSWICLGPWLTTPYWVWVVALVYLCFAIKRLAPLLQLMSSRVDQGVFSAQVVALVYLCLTALIQLNLLATRNPSLWWRFGSSTAPRHAPLLLCC